MKILGVCFSQRNGGNSEILLGEALKGSKELGAETEMISLRQKAIEPCRGCLICREKGECAIKDDMADMVPKLLAADGIIFSTPVYFYSMTGIGKSFLDRTFALRAPQLKLMNKVGGAITVASSSGNISALHTFNLFFLTNHMFMTDYVAGYASTKGAIRKHKHAMLGAYELGRFVTMTALSRPRFPDEFNKPLYMFIKDKYGIHMSPFEAQQDP